VINYAQLVLCCLWLTPHKIKYNDICYLLQRHAYDINYCSVTAALSLKHTSMTSGRRLDMRFRNLRTGSNAVPAH